MLSYIFAFVIFIITLIKLIEMWRCIIWAFYHGKYFMESISRDSKFDEKSFKESLSRHKHPPSPGNTVISKPIKWLFEREKGKYIVAFFFRYPVLLFVCSIIVFNSEDFIIRYSLCIVVVLALFTETIHLVLYRIQFGYIDNILNFFTVRFVRKDILFSISKHKSMQRLFLIYLVTFVVIVVAYAALYDTIIRGFVPGNYFISMSYFKVYEATWIQSFYFSMSTICTVGYGDIVPLGEIAKLLTISQMLLGFLLLVLLLSACIATLDSKEF